MKTRIMRQFVTSLLFLFVLTGDHRVKSLKGSNKVLMFNDSRNKTTKVIDLSGESFTAKAILHHFGIIEPASIDYVPDEDRVYWSDIRQGMILSSFSNATSFRVLFSCNVVKPFGLVIDKTGRNIFWTDEGAKRIEVGRLDGTKRKVLIENELDKPIAIALDIPHGLLYWTDVGKHPKIEEAGMDGSSRHLIVGDNLGAPTGLTIDHPSSRLFWIDAKLDRIEEFNLKTRQRKVRLSLKTGVLAYGLTIYQDWLYWSEWKTKSISRVSGNSNNLEVIATGLMKPMDFLVYDPAFSINSPCSIRNGLCSDLCLLNPTGYQCACPTGVPLLPDGKTCNHEFFDEASSDKFLLFAGSYASKIYKIPLAETLDSPCNALEIGSNITYPIAVDYDPREDKIYWTDGRLKAIVRAFLNGSSVEVIVRKNVITPDGLVIDWIGRNLYWSDAGTKKIEVSRLDGSSRMSLITTNIDKPRAIALDIAGSTMFWTDWGSSPKIERTNMDGTGRVVLVSFRLAWVNAIFLDIKNKHLYWFEARMKRVERIDFDGNNRRPIVLFKFWINLHPFALAFHDDILYWTDWSRKGVIKYNYTLQRGQLVWKGVIRPMGLHFHDSQGLYKGPSRCSHLNGECSNLCLPNPAGRQCFCPEGVSFVPGDLHICQGAVKCRSLPAPSNGIRQGCEGNITDDYLTTCHFSCFIGYYGSGSKVRKCLRNASWSGQNFSCQAVRCPRLEVPSNAVLLTPTCGNSYGANCVFGCQYGYASHSGNVTRACSPSGNWTGQVISCKDVLPPSFGKICPTNPLIVFAKRKEFSAVVNWTVPVANDNSGNPPKVQSNFKYPPQRLRQGNYLIIYTATDMSGNKATCSFVINVTVIYCKILNILPGGPLRMGSCGNHNGALCMFSCAIGYRLSGSSISMCIAPGDRPPGTWSNPLPSCEAIRCQSLSTPTNGSKTGCSGNATEVYGVRCSFSCKVGFRLNGSSVRYCMENGTWSGQTTTCKAIECDVLVPPKFGGVSPPRCLTSSKFGQECTFTCQDGYTLKGTSSRLCAFGGNWTGENDTICEDFSPPTFNETCPGNLVFYTGNCEDRVTVSWTDPVATDNSQSMAMTYPAIRPPANLTVGLYKILYTATDKKGNSANCSFAVQVTRISCPELQPPLHGTITSLSCESFLGSTASFSCNLGYLLVGSHRRSCQSNGTWSGNRAICNAVRCPAIKVHTHGDVGPQVCKSLPGVQYRASCFFTCNSSNGYKLEGPQNVSCQENGLWSADTRKTVCKDIQPPQIQCPSNIEVDAETNKSYATVNWTVPIPTDNSNTTMKAIGLYPAQKIEAGRTEITYNVTDSAGLSAHCRFTVKVKDTQPPRFRHCPSNVQIMSGKRWSKITLPPSYHTDNVGVTLFTTSIRNGSELTWGEYKIKYTIADKAGNTANCSFHISIAGSSCKDLPAPLNGAKACETWLVGMHCTVHCNKGYGFATDPQKLYFCSPKGQWINAEVKGNEKPHLPDCSKKQNPKDVRIKGRIHYLTDKCDGEESKKVVAEKFIALFKQHPVGFLGGCVYNDKCKIENVEVECGVRTRKRRETLKKGQTPRPYLQVAFTITVPLPNTSYQELNRTTQELSQNIGSDLEQMELDLNVSGVKMQVDKSESPVITVADYVCDKGQVKIESHCVNCPMGHFNNDKKGSCQKCPAGYYQDKEAKPSCVPCPSGTSTQGQEASKSRQDCRVICQVGHFYDTSKASCQKCPVDHYQDRKAQLSCIPCPRGTQTRGKEASKSRRDCHDKRCSLKRPPKNGAIACTSWSLGRYCTPFCNNGWDFTQSLTAFSVWFCNAKGAWVPRYWPDCSIPYQPNTVRRAGTSFYYSGDCTVPETRSQIQHLFIHVLNSSVFRMVCQLPTFRDKCKAGNVDVECITDDISSYTKKQKRVICQVGHFYDTSKASCQKCPVDHYQDTKAQLFCIPCPRGTHTRGKEASKSLHDCHET